MFANIYPLLLLLAPLSTTSQSIPTVLCIAGQCLQGYSDTTIGAKLSAPVAATSIHLLPGQYTATTNPQLLHDTLTSSSATLSTSPGFTNSSSVSLPLNLVLQPGLSIYSGTLYSGQSAFTSLPSSPVGNTSVPLTAKSLALSTNVWAALDAGSNGRVIVWDAIPDVGHLPSTNLGSLSLTDIQSAACSPSCAASGVCTASGTCQCAPGFTGVSCESCATGFFGPECQRCPANCKTCDEGITGSGRCLKPSVANDPSTCNCLNGLCGANGQCACNAGFTTADDGTACAKCSPGFFLTSTGDCQVCQLGCTACADGTGTCVTCKSGFSQDGNDRTKCNPPQSATTTGQVCPDESFSNGASCSQCSSTCQTCTGGSSNDCIICASGLFTFNGGCVSVNSDGVCEGSALIADNNKRECDSCAAKCTTCRIPNFSVASTFDQRQCTGCLPGFFLSDGKCVESCPSGTTVSSQDNLTCIKCDSSCGTCAGSPSFCLTCASNQLASAGKCVSNCPSGTFSATGSCLTCHPDCSSCSGGAFNQCSSCPSKRPVLVNGRCLPTCSKSQFFDPTSSTCQTCDSSCSSCSGPGPNNCLACSSSTQVLRTGSCVAANCQGSVNVIAGLGVCLSELIVIQPTGTGTDNTPLPTITGINTPTSNSGPRRLEWWQILLMALGCAFIFLVIIWLFRRRQRKQRAKRTALFSAGATVNRGRTSWRWRLIRFGEKLFGHTRSRRAPQIVHLGPVREESEGIKLSKLRAAEEARGTSLGAPSRGNGGSGAEEDMVKLIGSYNRPASPEPSKYHPYHTRLTAADQRSISDGSSQHSAPSMYSQVTGAPRRVPDPRQPLKKDLTSRFSLSTYGSAEHLQQSGSGKNPFRI
ncbi:TNFR/NGFR cysteine-rich region family protein [Crassisporium funariophilum]|nr:TNFR/NGFR cysteine-rich region family protein [Crassisporium funariophilum]